jgi:hypothetical protein
VVYFRAIESLGVGHRTGGGTHVTRRPCPACKKRLTKKEYESALGILEEREVHLEHVRAELPKKLKAAHR